MEDVAKGTRPKDFRTEVETGGWISGVTGNRTAVVSKIVEKLGGNFETLLGSSRTTSEQAARATGSASPASERGAAVDRGAGNDNAGGGRSCLGERNSWSQRRWILRHFLRTMFPT